MKSSNDVDKHIGSRIRMRRLELGVSQDKLAQALGLTFQQVQKYEKGTNRVGGSTMAKIAERLEVEPGFFYVGLGLPEGAGTASVMDAFIASDDGISIARSFVRIQDPKIRQRVMRAIRELCGAFEPEQLQAAE
ncbi:Helix-turn-helix [Bradyrhizobium brasilense]|uniref:Helix-turn-helix n=1 Tax=Bradyrhizobium brasilense TaxID=1419277 RepID=A0A1G6YSM6_9BRAD|nr:helix-turn-helix transcriptional regulator [Bradyrhizobium brasilense]SDD93368.1 Helix-turn-helix [Bradyrhizobium brasilense]